jgi:hypothetical protein
MMTVPSTPKSLSGFFVLSPRDARRALIVLASHTGWTLTELLELDGHELMAWLDVLPTASRKGEAR